MAKRVGLAFSGGGSRSAAFCSGVLRRVLQKSLPVDYLSSVSGGGFVASAYLDWKFRHEQQDDPEWHQRFFDHLRKRIGFYANWNNPLFGCLEFLLLLFFVLLISVVLPTVNWFPLAFPVAFFINLCFGDILRGDFYCGRSTNDSSTKTYNLSKKCVPLNLPVPMERTEAVFAVFILLFLFFSILTMFSEHKCKVFGNFLRNLSGFAFLMVFLPWFIEQYLYFTALWVNGLIIVFSVVIWLGFPPLRNKATLALIVYFYAYVVKWRVFQTPVLGYDYTFERFVNAMWISGLVLWVAPFFGLLQQGAIQAYNRWRLQKAFYTRESVGWNGCYGIEITDFFPSSKCLQSEYREPNDRALTIGDLEGMKPEWICNVLVDRWQIHCAEDLPKYELLTLTPSGIRRLDWDKGDNQFEDLTPDDIKLSDAMATSAAALSTHMGSLEERMELFRNLQVILGFSGGRSLNMNPREASSLVFPILVQMLLVVPIVVFPFVQWIPHSLMEPVRIILGAWFVTVFLVLAVIAVIPVGAEKPSALERLVRWCIVHIYHVRFIREMYDVTNIGPIAPPILSLSDGGHIENLGLLALFQRKLEKIVVVDGGFVKRHREYGDDLLCALELARKKLNCSFTGIGGRDIIEDVRENFVERSPGNQPRFYRFKVEYYHRSSPSVQGTKIGQGEVLLLSPRHPLNGTLVEVTGPRKTWKDHGLELDVRTWGIGPALEAWEVDQLTGCCCECCHCSPCGCLSAPLCGVFPNHSTANQFMTPAMFTAYHREGYRTCVEAEVEMFLQDATDELVTKPVTEQQY